MTFVTAATMSSASPQRVDREVEGRRERREKGETGGGGGERIIYHPQ